MKKIPQAHDGLYQFAARVWPIGLLAMSSLAFAAAPVPANLGNGLGELVAKQVAKAQPRSALAQQRATAAAVGDQLTFDGDTFLRDATGRVMVDVVVDGRSSYRAVRMGVNRIAGVSIVAEEAKYRAGIIELYVPESSLVELAQVKGVSAVHGVVKPVTNVGLVTSQGVVQHRIDQLPANLNGTGISIGVISDSYNTSTTTTTKEVNDVASGDLPGPGNPAGNLTPVIVFQDFAGGTDEGRGMMQLVHDSVPKAKLAFATANSGEVGFANNIRALAGVQGLTNSRTDFKADIVVDDVQYYDEGMFSDGVIAQAVDDVTALGVSYFSSAGNTAPTQGYASDLRIVPNNAGALAGTNINLANVPASAYAGGFHNFRSDGGLDIAQTVTLGTTRQLAITMQWDDPYDVTPTSVSTQILQTTGNLATATSSVDNSFTGVSGNQYVVDVHGTVSDVDVIVTVINPDGTTQQTVDTGTSENFAFFAPQTGTYIIRVTGYNGSTGVFQETISNGTGTLSVTSDFNILFFHPTTGAYLGCACENNLLTNRPVELPGSMTFPASVTTSQVQLVIARGNIPTAPVLPGHVRYKLYASTNGSTGYPAEYFSYSTPVTYGHNSAAGANGVAAYSPFRPNIPEDFTSTGPVRIVWDRANHRIPDDQQIRLKPEMAAMDGGNTTFFSSDTNRDLDTFPNFFGTSAAAPTAASIAALVLQNKGGPGSVTPAQMRTMLQRSAFTHDLDPYYSKGTATTTGRGKVTITLEGDNSTSARLDPNAFTVTYTGSSSITSITFDGSNGNPGGGNVSVASTPGLVFDTRAAGQPFVVGAGTVPAAAVVATTTNQAPAPSVAGEFYGLNLAFTSGAFTGGKTLKFGIGRDVQRSAFAPPVGDTRAANSGDLAGSVTRQPEGTLASGGITFTGTLADGTTFSGVMQNRLGSGWSFLDGYGFINAQSAVSQPLP